MLSWFKTLQRDTLQGLSIRAQQSTSSPALLQTLPVRPHQSAPPHAGAQHLDELYLKKQTGSPRNPPVRRTVLPVPQLGGYPQHRRLALAHLRQPLAPSRYDAPQGKRHWIPAQRRIEHRPVRQRAVIVNLHRRRRRGPHAVPEPVRTGLEGMDHHARFEGRRLGILGHLREHGPTRGFDLVAYRIRPLDDDLVEILAPTAEQVALSFVVELTDDRIEQAPC
mmetsp:Transcript_11451/g.28213  ORF Transcript_11451/g.28213 Transcript_11451/m.28213 type:complete len:222 (+) Transcript_11451:480-1145(+)